MYIINQKNSNQLDTGILCLHDCDITSFTYYPNSFRLNVIKEGRLLRVDFNEVDPFSIGKYL